MWIWRGDLRWDTRHSSGSDCWRVPVHGAARRLARVLFACLFSVSPLADGGARGAHSTVGEAVNGSHRLSYSCLFGQWVIQWSLSRGKQLQTLAKAYRDEGLFYPRQRRAWHGGTPSKQTWTLSRAVTFGVTFRALAEAAS